MNNQYIFYPNINLDLDKIKEIVMRRKLDSIPGMATHHRRVADEPYLIELQNLYPFLGSIYNIYTTSPGYITPIHVCPGRSCALNIPISYTEDSHTVFYEIPEDASIRYNKTRIYQVINSAAVEVFRYTLTEPVIMNTLLPHGVFGGKRQERTIMSWSIDFNYSYDQLKDMLSYK
jgi:hypothetical protein